VDRFHLIEAFVRVAHARSFTEAARQMRISRPILTARVKQLEKFVGAPLFVRSTRSVRPSELGEIFLRECSEWVEHTEELVQQMREAHTEPAGRLRVHALPGFVLGHLAATLHGFQTRYPNIALHLVVNDVAINPVKEGFDCALQMFSPHAQELVSRRLFPVRRVFCASPDYCQHHGTPQIPAQLQQHRIGWYSGYPTRERVVLYAENGEVESVQLKPALLSNSVHLLNEYALEHAGIVCLPTLVASASLMTGQLVRVLPQHQLSSFWLNIFYPLGMRNSPKLRVFLEALTENFTGTPPWDAALLRQGMIPETLIV